MKRDKAGERYTLRRRRKIRKSDGLKSVKMGLGGWIKTVASRNLEPRYICYITNVTIGHLILINGKDKTGFFFIHVYN